MIGEPIENFSFERYRPEPGTGEYKRVKRLESDPKIKVYWAVFEYHGQAAWIEWPISVELINDKYAWPLFVQTVKEESLRWARENWKEGKL